MPAGLGRRPIASVADLFLTSPPETDACVLGPPEEAVVPAPAKAIEPDVTLPVSLVLASALSDDAAAAVNDYARNLASRGRSVAVLTLSPVRRALRLFEPVSEELTQTDPVPPPWPVAAETGGSSPAPEQERNAGDLPRELGRDDLARTLRMSEHCLVAWLGRPDLIPRNLRAAAVVVTVLAGSDEPQLVEAYRNVKRAAAQWPEARLGVFVTGARDPRTARRTGNRLTSLVTGFLGRPVRFEGFTTRQTAVRQRFVAERPVDRHRPQEDRRWLAELADFLSRHADRDAAASAWIAAPPDETPDDGAADDPTLRTVVPDTSVALPLAEPLTNVGQLDACLGAGLPLWCRDAVSFVPLEHDDARIAVRHLTRSDGTATIVASVLDPHLPALEAALYAARALSKVAELMLVTPTTDRCLTTPLLSCALRALQFRQIRIDDRYGLLLTPCSGPCAPL